MRKTWPFDSGDFDFETSGEIRWAIRRNMNRQSLTTKELAAKARLSNGFLCRLLDGRRRLSLDHVKTLSSVLQIPLSTLGLRLQHRIPAHDRRLTSAENRRLEGMLDGIRNGLVSYLINEKESRRANRKRIEDQ